MKKKTKKLSDRVVEFILSRHNEELAGLTLSAIADILGVDREEMAAGFEKDRNVPLDTFIVREKMHRAVFLIEKKKETSIRELAGQMGYSTVGRFSREFQNYLLIEPGKYQRLVSR